MFVGICHHKMWNVHFSCKVLLVTYLQTDGVALGSPVGPILARIFIVHL